MPEESKATGSKLPLVARARFVGQRRVLACSFRRNSVARMAARWLEAE